MHLLYLDNYYPRINYIETNASQAFKMYKEIKFKSYNLYLENLYIYTCPKYKLKDIKN